MRRNGPVGGAHAFVLIAAAAIAWPMACRDFRDGPSMARAGSGEDSLGGGAAQSSEGGVPAFGATGGAPSPHANGGDSPNGGDTSEQNVSGQSSRPLVAGMGGELAEASAGAAAGGHGGGGAAGQGGDSLVPAEELAPNDFPTLVLWLEASEEACSVDVADNVWACRDGSSYGNDAFERPSYDVPKYARAVINGHAALHFEPLFDSNGDYPTTLQVADTQSMRFGADDFAYVVVMRWNNSEKVRFRTAYVYSYNGSGGILSKQNGVPPYNGIFLMANLPSPFLGADAGTRFAVQLSVDGPLAISYSDGLNDNAFRVYTLRRRGTDLALRINGDREGGTKLKPNVDASGEDGALLLGGVIGQPLRGDIAELVGLKGNFTDDELHALEQHLIVKYALK